MSTTETASGRYAAIETWPTADLVDAMVEGQMAAVAALAGCRDAIAHGIDAAAERLARGGRLLYLGAGTSGRIATLDAAELPPTYAWPPERAQAFIAGGARAITRSVEGAEDDEGESVAALDAAGMTEADVVIGIAASGRTPYVRAGLRHARGRGALTIAVSNNADGTIMAEAEIAIVAATGAEVVAGSTRMKAGTAQKAVLTCLSTGIFVRLGHVWRGRMVEMAPTNAKLARRAELMVADLASVDEATAKQALQAGSGSIKVAVVMLLCGIDARMAEARLKAAGGLLHEALNA